MTTPVDLRHPIDCSVDDFWRRIHQDARFNHALFVEKLGYGFDVQEDDILGSGVRRVKVTPVVDAPAPIQRALGDSVSFIEDGRFVTDPERVYSFRILPNVLADKISISGQMRIEPRGDQYCDRVVHFDIGCKLFGIGRLFESFVAKEIRGRYEDSWRFTNDYLREHPEEDPKPVSAEAP